jgi:trans-aconitate methyltransferase
MIEKAKKLDRKNQYFCNDLMNWSPNKKVNIVHSMEVFYYFERPDKLIQHVYENWMLEGGRLIMGIDYYQENKPSHTWKEDCCITTMKMFSKNDWVNFFKTTGFKNLESWYHGKDGDWNGTLIVTGIK